MKLHSKYSLNVYKNILFIFPLKGLIFFIGLNYICWRFRNRCENLGMGHEAIYSYWIILRVISLACWKVEAMFLVHLYSFDCSCSFLVLHFTSPKYKFPMLPCLDSKFFMDLVFSWFVYYNMLLAIFQIPSGNAKQSSRSVWCTTRSTFPACYHAES